MNFQLKQEKFIEYYFNIDNPNQKGWRKNLSGCPYCNDGSSKNPRSYFIFSEEQIGFHCFNCGAKQRFNSKNINSLANFISKSTWNKVGNILLKIKKEKIFPNTNLINQKEIEDNVENEHISLINYKNIDLPDVSILLWETNVDKIAPSYRKSFLYYKDKAIEYLKSKGVYDIAKNKKLYICLEGDFRNRLILPIYFDGKLISYAARALFRTKTKYLYPPTTDEYNERGRIIYNLEKIFKPQNVKQIFVTESIVDSWVFDGMAILSKNITKEQIIILNEFNFHQKQLLFIMDKDKINFKSNDMKGLELGKKILSLNKNEWKVSYPEFPYPIKDVTESYVELGLLETYDRIINGKIDKMTELMLKSRLGNIKQRRKI
jgi:hypothetical protein